LFDLFDTLRPDTPRSAWIHRDGNLAEPQGWSNRASSLLLYDFYR
jgi:hypothetical protein